MIGLRRKVYCDNNATTKPSRGVITRMDAVLRHCFANPSSPYKIARDAAAVLEDSRAQVAGAVGAQAGEIIFTGSATEANNHLISIASLLPAHRRSILCNSTEHPSIMEVMKVLEKDGFRVHWLPVDRYGRVLRKKYVACLNRARKEGELFGLVVCMLANNENGAVNPVPLMTPMAHKHGALFYCDCVQALGKIPVDVEELGVDYASFSAHKIHGPKGVGALYVRSGASIAPYLHGGHQEDGLRAGTEGLHNIAGFGQAAAEIPALLAAAPALAERRGDFAAGLMDITSSCVFNTPLLRENADPDENNWPEDQGPLSVPGTLSVTFPGQSNSSFMGALDYAGVSVSAGSACSTGDDEPSHVLLAQGLSPEQARETLRFSFAPDFTARDLRYVLSAASAYLKDAKGRITGVMPGQLDENMLSYQDLYIVDVRAPRHRRKLRGLPGSVEYPLYTIGRHLDKIPRDRPLLLVCLAGYDAPLVAYYLKAKGFKKLSFLMFGLWGWKRAHPDLYRRLAGRNIRNCNGDPVEGPAEDKE